MRVSYVNKIEYKNEGARAREKKTELHQFYRLSFSHFQGLRSMELDEEHDGEWRTRRKKRRDSQIY